jgi:hypothetical protein
MPSSTSSHALFRRHPLWSAALAAAMGLGLSACGGGGGGDSGNPADNSALALSGTAATGAAISGGTLEVKCATGTATGTTGANGAWTLNVSGGTLPCVVRVTSGSTVLHSVVPPQAVGSTALVVNVTPLTELVVAHAAGGSAAGLFASFDGAAQAKVTASTVQQAISSTAAALSGVVDLSGINPLTDPLVAASGTTAGNAQDQLLDRLRDSLAASQVSLDQLRAAVVAAAPDSAPVLAGLAPVAGTCPSLRSGIYRVINPHETIHDTGYASHLITVDAGALTLVDNLQSLPRTPVSLSPVEGSPCRYTVPGDFSDTDTLLVSPAGVMVLLSQSINGPTRTSFIIPEQSLPLSALAGTWNRTSYQRTGTGPLLPSNGTITLNSTGVFTAGTDCEALVCSPSDVSGLGTVQADARGGFSLPDGSRLFAHRAANGGTTVLVLGPLEEGMTWLTPQTATSLPAVGNVVDFWDFTVGAGAFAWSPAGGASAVTTGQITITSVDAGTGTVNRVRTSDGRVDSHLYNQPRDGLRQRVATATLSRLITMPLPGTGLTLSYPIDAAQNFLSISVTRPPQ